MWESPDRCTYSPIYYILASRKLLSGIYNTCPKILMKFVYEKNIISYVGCMAQLFLFLFFVISECCILTSMAYDRCLAICNPLLYEVTVSSQVCSMLSLASYRMVTLLSAAAVQGQEQMFCFYELRASSPMCHRWDVEGGISP